MTATLQLAPQDTLPGIISRWRAADPAAAGRVLLVVPPPLSLSAVDLSLLRREAAARGCDIALLTANAGLRARAAEAGISTFRSRGWAERVRWRPARADRRAGRPAGEATAVAPYGAGLYARRSPSGFRPASFLRAFVSRPSPWWTDLGLAAALLLIFGGLLYALATVIPAATITLVPAAEPIEVTVPLTAIQDVAADPQLGIVPAYPLSTQVTGEGKIATTGRRYEAAAKARGNVVLINQTARAVTAPSGTVVATATGNNVRFVTTADAPLAPNGRATVPVEAILPGPSGNVRAGTITHIEGSLSLSVLVANDAALAGGTLAQVGVVTQADKEKLQAQLFEELRQKALERLNERLAPGTFIPPDSVTYLTLSPTFTPFEGEAAPELSLSMSVQAVGLVADATAGNKVALARLQGAMPPGTRLISDTVRYIPGSVNVVDGRTIRFSTTAEGTLLRGVDTEAVRSAVLGMTPEAATAALAERFALARRPQISLGPDWLPYIVPTNVPALPWRVRVIVDWDRAAQIATAESR